MKFARLNIQGLLSLVNIPVCVDGLISALVGWVFVSTVPVITVCMLSSHEARQSTVGKNDGMDECTAFFLDLLKNWQQIGAWNGN